MSGIRDVVARMAADAAFAEQVRSHPDEVAQQYGLSTDEIEKVLGLADAESPAGPAPLGSRLSRSGIGAGGVLSLLSSLGDAADQAVTPMKMVPPKAGPPTFEPTESIEPHAKPHMAVPAAATEPPVEESTSTDQGSVKAVPIKMVPPAFAGPEPHLDLTTAPEPPHATLAAELAVLQPPESSDGAPVDQVAINFTKIEFEPREPPDEGGVRRAGWDLDQAKDS